MSTWKDRWRNRWTDRPYFIRPFCLLPGVQLYKDQQIQKGRSSMKKTNNNAYYLTKNQYDSNHPGMTAKLKKIINASLAKKSHTYAVCFGKK